MGLKRWQLRHKRWQQKRERRCKPTKKKRRHDLCLTNYDNDYADDADADAHADDVDDADNADDDADDADDDDNDDAKDGDW